MAGAATVNKSTRALKPRTQTSRRQQTSIQTSTENVDQDDIVTKAPPRKRQRRNPIPTPPQSQGEDEPSTTQASESQRRTRASRRGRSAASTVEEGVAASVEAPLELDPALEALVDEAAAEEIATIPTVDTPAVQKKSGTAETDTIDDNPLIKKRKRPRALTPEEDRDHEINTQEVVMSDLTKNTRKGRKSKLEEKMQEIDWAEVARRRKAEEEERVARAMNPDLDDDAIEPLPAEDATNDAAQDDDPQVDGQNDELQEDNAEEEAQQEEEDTNRKALRGPRLKWVNGEMVFDNDSLIRDTETNMDDETVEAEEQNDVTRRVTSHSWINSNRRDPVERARNSNKSDPWSVEETNAFYDALRGFGTDFFLISKMFPGKTRNHVKRKFVREEKADPDRIRRALLQESVELDMDVFLAAANRREEDYKNPEALEEELRLAREEQTRQIEQEKAERQEKDRKRQEKAKEKAEAVQRSNKKKRERKKKQARRKDGTEHTERFEVDGELLVVEEHGD